ncbi:hypothetical protein ACTXT7_004262 [Hymenolepis weldensis]
MYNYFENKITHIISRSGLGYVGKLHSIDTKHNTVTLSKVRVVNNSNGDQISSQVYDIVIFRGVDMQDVFVREPTLQDLLMENDSAVTFKENSRFANNV